MIRIDLTKGKVALIDDSDFALISNFNWHTIGKKHYLYAATHTPSGKRTYRRTYMHRLLMNPEYGMVVDHINGNGLDNRRSNLRICTHVQNHMNSVSRRGTSKYKGVYCKKNGRWYAAIAVNKKDISLGGHDSQEKAATAYNEAARKYHGDFACLNRIES